MTLAMLTATLGVGLMVTSLLIEDGPAFRRLSRTSLGLLVLGNLFAILGW